MQTIGTILSVARHKKKLSITRLAQKTKIKEEYLEALEHEDWEKLPNFATAVGFVKTVAHVIDVPQDAAVALLRREFPPEKLKTKHPASLKTTFVWTPTMTSIVAVCILGAGIFLYLFHQYKVFVAPPPLTVSTRRINNESILVSGKTSSQANVMINNEPIVVHTDGAFEVTIAVKSGEELTITAVSRSGKSAEKQIAAP